MNYVDCTGFVGVAILLIAFALNTTGKISREDVAYIFMNLIGAGIACAASVMLDYWPFIILEGAWLLVSLIALVNHFRK